MDDSAMAGRVHGLDLYPGGNWLSEAGVREGEQKAAADGKESTGPPLIEAVVGEGVAHVLAATENALKARPRPPNGSTSATPSRSAIATGSWSACSNRPARRSIPKSGPSAA